jgi:hypothetical protein
MLVIERDARRIERVELLYERSFDAAQCPLEAST